MCKFDLEFLEFCDVLVKLVSLLGCIAVKFAAKIFVFSKKKITFESTFKGVDWLVMHPPSSLAISIQ